MSSLIRRRSLIIAGLLIASFSIVAANAGANIKADVIGTSGYTSNLLNDSTEIEDSYYTVDANINFYPVSPLEINLNNRYTYYSKYFKLSNFAGAAGLKLVPLPPDSRLKIFLTGRYSSQIYRDSINIDNNNVTNISSNNDNYDFGLSAGYKFAPAIYGRLGTSYNYLNYTDYSGASRGAWKFFAGLNFTILKNNSVDIETGYSIMDYKRFPDSLRIIFRLPDFEAQKAFADSILQDDKLRSFYISPRFSRPLGSKTGFNITYLYRKFYDFDDKRVYGLNSGFLSPWASAYEGPSITATIKTYLIPGFITNLGAGYWDKTFFWTLERWDGPVYIPTPARRSFLIHRHDYQTRLYFTISRLLKLSGGTTIEPTFIYEYEKNVSTASFYFYRKQTVSFAINIKM
jgi:hypothetical protein